jgi:hypothetical protein
MKQLSADRATRWHRTVGPDKKEANRVSPTNCILCLQAMSEVPHKAEAYRI